MAAKDPRTQERPFLQAPYVHPNNEPKYHALLVRAVEHAKRSAPSPSYILWVVAEDHPTNPAEVGRNDAEIKKKAQRWLQYHDQLTEGIPGLFPLYYGMKVRVTEVISKKLQILKHAPCTVVGWTLHPAEQDEEGVGERVLRKLPSCIYVKFEDADWKLKGVDLEKGVSR